VFVEALEWASNGVLDRFGVGMEIGVGMGIDVGAEYIRRKSRNPISKGEWPVR